MIRLCYARGCGRVVNDTKGNVFSSMPDDVLHLIFEHGAAGTPAAPETFYRCLWTCDEVTGILFCEYIQLEPRKLAETAHGVDAEEIIRIDGHIDTDLTFFLEARRDSPHQPHASLTRRSLVQDGNTVIPRMRLLLLQLSLRETAAFVNAYLGKYAHHPFSITPPSAGARTVADVLFHMNTEVCTPARTHEHSTA